MLSDRFDNLLVVVNITDQAHMNAMLLHLAGEALRLLAGEVVYDVHQGLVVEPVPEGADPAVDNEYINAKHALDVHFSLKCNTEFEIYTFCRSTQANTETLEAYHTHLRALSKHCQFRNQLALHPNLHHDKSKIKP